MSRDVCMCVLEIQQRKTIEKQNRISKKKTRSARTETDSGQESFHESSFFLL